MSNIKSHINEVVVKKLQKQKAGYTLLLTLAEKNDDWLINVYKYRTKSGEITHECMILKPEIESYLGYYFKEGYIEV
jgi:hypothetical protein